MIEFKSKDGGPRMAFAREHIAGVVEDPHEKHKCRLSIIGQDKYYLVHETFDEVINKITGRNNG